MSMQMKNGQYENLTVVEPTGTNVQQNSHSHRRTLELRFPLHTY